MIKEDLAVCFYIYFLNILYSMDICIHVMTKVLVSKKRVITNLFVKKRTIILSA